MWKVGDRVNTFSFGWGTIIEVDEIRYGEKPYRVKADSDGHTDTFSEHGFIEAVTTAL